jgi:pimeloyl-ACP methyl ester carboxylesterase
MADPSPRPATKKSTSAGSSRATLAAGFRFLGRVAPPLAAALAERMFFMPPRPRRSRGDSMLRRGRRFRLRVDGRDIAAWKWGRGPAVVLLHGWGGHSGQLTSFVPPLLSQGLSAVALDAPGHGQSSRGLSSAVQFARALHALVETTGPVQGLVAHSLGGCAAALAVRDGLPVARVVLIAAPVNPPAWVEPFAVRFGITPEVVDRMKRRSERRIGFLWDDLQVPVLVAGLRQPLLVIHDRHDAEVPLSDGAKIAAAWPGARLVETAGLGHNRVLRDPEVIAQVVDFVAAEAPVSACPCGGGHAKGTCAAYLEQNLYDREARWAEWGSGPNPATNPSVARGTVFT